MREIESHKSHLVELIEVTVARNHAVQLIYGVHVILKNEKGIKGMMHYFGTLRLKEIE